MLAKTCFGKLVGGGNVATQLTSGQVFRNFLHVLTSQGWSANIVVGIALGLIFILVTSILTTPGAKIIGGGIGLTILLWVGILALYKAVTITPAPVAASVIPVIIPASEDPARPASKEKTSSTSNAESQKESMDAKQQSSVSIRQTNPVNSPNIIGNNNQVSISPTPPPRSLTQEQKDSLINQLGPLPKISVDIVTVNSSSEVEGFADSFEELVRQLNWTLKSRVVSLVPSRGAGLGVSVRSQTEHPPAADRLIVLLRSMGYAVEAAVAGDLDANEVRLFVSSQR